MRKNSNSYIQYIILRNKPEILEYSQMWYIVCILKLKT